MHTYFYYSPKENIPLHQKKKKSSEGLKVTGIHKDKEKRTEDKFYQQQFGSGKADGQKPAGLVDQRKLKLKLAFR